MIRHLLLLGTGAAGALFAKGIIEKHLMTEDEKIDRRLRDHGKKRELRIQDIAERYSAKFEEATAKMREALDTFQVPSDSWLRVDRTIESLVSGCFKNYTLNYFRGSSRHYGVADQILDMVFFLKNSGIPWGDGSPEGEWSRYVTKEVWWPLLSSMTHEPDDKSKGLEQEIVLLERTIEVLL